MLSQAPTSFVRLLSHTLHKNCRFAGAPDDPLLRADAAKKERASRALEDTAREETTKQLFENDGGGAERAGKGDQGVEHREATGGQNSKIGSAELSRKNVDDEENLGNAQEKQVCVQKYSNRHRTTTSIYCVL